MSFIPPKDSLFRYYRYILSIENILSAKAKYNSLSRPTRYSVDIRDKWSRFINMVPKKGQKKAIFFENDMMPSAYFHQEADIFFDEMEFFEQLINLRSKGENKLSKDLSTIEKHQDFTFAIEASYAYCIIVNFAKIKKSDQTFFPMAALMLPSLDKQFKPIPFNRIRELAKSILGIAELPEDFDIEPQEIDIIVNPKLMELDLSQEGLFNVTVQTAQDLQKKISGVIKDIKSTMIQDERLVEGIFLGAVSQNFTRGLLTIYDSLQESGYGEVLKQYFSIHQTKGFGGLEDLNHSNIITTKQIVESFKNHYGSFDSQYALQASQRKAMACYLQNDQTIIPINGAPGTGKTSLLRAISGDYIVKSALNAYEKYKKTNRVEFATPIVCSSTNNQALYNICEGLESGFKETLKCKKGQDEKKSVVLYERWIDATHEIKKNTNDVFDEDDRPDHESDQNIIDFSKTLYAPVVKSKATNYFAMTKSMIASVMSMAAKSHSYYLDKFAVAFPNVKIDQESSKKQLLECAKHLKELIEKNIQVIESGSLNHDVLQALEKYEIAAIMNNKNMKSSDLKNMLAFIRDKDSNFLNQLEHPAIVNPSYLSNLKMSLVKLSKKLDELKGLKSNAEAEILKLSEEKVELNNKRIDLSDMDPSSYPNYKTKEMELIDECIEADVNSLNRERESSIREEKHSAGLIAKVLFLFSSGPIAQGIESVNQRIDNQITACKMNRNRYKDKVNDDLISRITKMIVTDVKKIEKKIIKIDESIDKHEKLGLQYLSEINSIESNINTKTNEYGIGVKTLEDVEKYLSNGASVTDIRSILDLIMHYRTMLNCDLYEEEKAKLDTSLRTDNFYYALHLLEALYLIHFIEDEGEHFQPVCPACNEGILKKDETIEGTELKRDFICQKCKARCAWNNYKSINALKNQSDRWFENLFNKKTAFCEIDGEIYMIDINRVTNGNPFINIVKGKSDWHMLLPIFPVINMTCNSMGTMISEKKGDKKYIEPGLFDFMLIDEAGTIPPSKMVILQAAKRVMFFGDVKQLKPVFPFDVDFERKVLERFLNDQRSINETADSFSCASDVFTFGSAQKPLQRANNAMSVANNATTFFMPYNQSKLEGDIWLKEHFRCAESIVAIANELTYHNEVIPKKDDSSHYKHLYFVERGGEKDQNNVNKIEGEAIVQYILEKKEEFKSALKIDDDLEYFKGIGIVTPFTNQHFFIEGLVNAKAVDIPGISNVKVGTVHKYQGSERPIIIFSTVYGNEHMSKTANMFFNRGETDMINVAVTRAKDIFICFGNKKALEDNKTYSGLMLKHILNHNNDVLNM